MAQVPNPPAGPATDKRPRVRRRWRTPQEARAWRRRLMGYALFAAAFVLMVDALVGENGYLATMRARNQTEQLSDQLARLRIKNLQIKEEIERLRKDPAALEEAARRELNMIRPGEKLIIIRDPQPAKPAPPPR